MNKEKVYIETYGCQMNTYDSELVKSILVESNYSLTDDIISANVALLNTCSVRENANNKVLNRVHEIKQLNKNIMVGVLGCMATNFKTDLLDNKRLKIDLIAGPDSYKALPNLIEDAVDAQQSTKPFDVTLSEFETYDQVPATRSEGANAWLAIMRGCNNFCTFCVVPYTRGRERSRSVQSVLDEVNQLVDNGFKQVTLLGQNVNSYRYGADSFTDLLDAVSSKTGIERIRFTSPHPKDFPLDLLKLINERKNICKQLHVPLQAGNDRVLKKMNRTYTQNEFLHLIREMKQEIPNVSLSTDIIVGFPTETHEEFLKQKKFVKRLGLITLIYSNIQSGQIQELHLSSKMMLQQKKKKRELWHLLKCKKDILENKMNVGLERNKKYFWSVLIRIKWLGEMMQMS